MNEVLWEVSALEDIDDATHERVMLLTHRLEAHSVQKETLNNIKEA